MIRIFTMSQIPADLKYTSDHEWLRLQDDGTAYIGITDYAQETLGDVTFVELPPVGKQYAKKQTFGVVESVKAASDLYMPLACEILEVNEALVNAPETINTDPYGEAWMVRIRLTNPEEVGSLLDAGDYGATL